MLRYIPPADAWRTEMTANRRALPSQLEAPGQDEPVSTDSSWSGTRHRAARRPDADSPEINHRLDQHRVGDPATTQGKRLDAALAKATTAITRLIVRFPRTGGGVDNRDRDTRDAEEVRPGVP
jgi:hypothetical protein